MFTSIGPVIAKSGFLYSELLTSLTQGTSSHSRVSTTLSGIALCAIVSALCSWIVDKKTGEVVKKYACNGTDKDRFEKITAADNWRNLSNSAQNMSGNKSKYRTEHNPRGGAGEIICPNERNASNNYDKARQSRNN